MTAAATTVRTACGPGGHTLAVSSQDNKIRLRDVIGGAVPDVGTGLVELVAHWAGISGSRCAGALDLVPRWCGWALPGRV